MSQQSPLHCVFYIAAPPERVWQGSVCPNPTRSSLWGRTRSRSEAKRLHELGRHRARWQALRSCHLPVP